MSVISHRAAAALAAAALLIPTVHPLTASALTVGSGARVVSYSPGAAPTNFDGPWTNSAAALGLPAGITPSSFFVFSPFNGPFGADAVTQIGAGGHLTLQLSHAVAVTNTAPELGLFSIHFLRDAQYPSATATDPVELAATDFVTGLVQTNRAQLELSADGTNFVSLGTVAAPMFFNYYTDLGSNCYVEQPGAQTALPGRPFTGSLTDFAGLRYDAIVGTLNGSCGGTWIDADPTGLTEVRFLRLSLPNGSPDVFGLDAVAANYEVTGPALFPNSLTLSAPDSVEEGQSWLVSAQLGYPIAQDLVLPLEPHGGTALPGDDIATNALALRIPSNTLSGSLALTVFAETEGVEGAETFALRLNTNALPPDLQLGPATVSVTVEDVPSPVPGLTGFVVTPLLASNAVGQSVAFQAIGQLITGASTNLTSLAAWSSFNPNIAVVTNGVVRGITNGTATIVARLWIFDAAVTAEFYTAPAATLAPLTWSIELKTPRATKKNGTPRPLRFKSAKGLRPRPKGTITGPDLPTESDQILVELAVRAVATNAGSNGPGTIVWQPAGNVRRTKSAARFIAAKGLGEGVSAASGDSLELLIRASSNFSVATTPTNSTLFLLK